MNQQQNPSQTDLKPTYRRHLRTTLHFGELVSCLSFIAVYLMVLDILEFTSAGTSFVHPILAIFILVAATMLFLIASTSMIKTSQLLLKEDIENRKNPESEGTDPR